MITKDRMKKMRKLTLDFELAKLVLKIGVEMGDHPSYCTFASHTMPLQIKYKIGLQPTSDGWQAFAATGDFYDDPNPYRAIVCCLILVLQE